MTPEEFCERALEFANQNYGHLVWSAYPKGDEYPKHYRGVFIRAERISDHMAYVAGTLPIAIERTEWADAEIREIVPWIASQLYGNGAKE